MICSALSELPAYAADFVHRFVILHCPFRRSACLSRGVVLPCLARLFGRACLLRSHVADCGIDAAGMEVLAPSLVHQTDLRVLELSGKLQERCVERMRLVP